MSQFDFWQRWGFDLNDAEFACAWAALGVAAAATSDERTWGKRRETPAAIVARAIGRSGISESRLPWAFPPVAQHSDAPRREPPLVQGTSPQDWARAWADAPLPDGPEFATSDSRPRLRIMCAPPGEPARPWLRLLAEAEPRVAALSFTLDAPQAEMQVGWPLRFGFLPNNAAQGFVDSARFYWPANHLSQSVALERGRTNCDLLVYRGTARGLLRELLDLPIRVKANVVVLKGSGHEEWGDVSAQLAAIVSEVRASGYVLLPEGADDAAVGPLLNDLLSQISHAKTFDAVVAQSCGHEHYDSSRAYSDVIAGFTDEFIEFRISTLAVRYTQRMQSLPAGSELDLSLLGIQKFELAQGARGVHVAIPPEPQPTAAGAPPAPPPAAPPTDVAVAPAPEAAAAPVDDIHRVPADAVRLDAGEMEFANESGGSSDLALVGAALDEATIPPQARAARAARFLQQRSYVRRGHGFVDAHHGFIAGVSAMVRLRIGPQDDAWNALAAEFPVERLPQYLEQWNLTVWLSEPNHFPTPLKGRIKLPQDGASTECEFNFVPASFPDFEGRMTVLHRGRVIQTAVLRAAVLPAGAQASAAAASGPAPPQAGKAPSLEDWIPVRQRLGELGERREYDLAFVLNHTQSGRPLVSGLSDTHAWLSDLSKSVTIAKDINARLSPVAKSVADYAQGLDSVKGRALLVQLALLGRYLHIYLVEEQLGASGNRPNLAREEYLQIVSTRSDAVIPFEFIYEYETPDDDAELCPHWRQGVKNGACGTDCDTTSGKRVCPMGFWGLSKVIERHALTPELANSGRELYLQSETCRESDTLHLRGVGVFGASERVLPESLTAFTASLAERTGHAPGQATDWDSWVEMVRDNRPSLLVALAHTDGNGANVSLEIGGKTIKSIQIKKHHIRSNDDDPLPLVALLGCDAAGTADDYGHHVAVFRARGAAVVIGTIATVFGDHAAQVAFRLVEGLLSDSEDAPERLGEALRALKRQALLDDLLMPLCLVAYGDADWKLVRE